MERNVHDLVKYWEDVPGKMSIKDVDDKYIKENLAILLNNQKTKDLRKETIFETAQGHITNTQATTNDTTAGAFQPISLALVRRTFPELFANKVVGVQAMAGPVGLAYALRFLYDDSANSVQETEAAFNNVDDFSGFTGSQSGTSSTDTDSGRGLTTAQGEALEIGATLANGQMPELSLRIDQTAVTATTRKLAASFSLEAAQDIKAMHGVDIEREMVNVLQYEIQAEMDREIVDRIRALAVDTGAGGEAATSLYVTSGSSAVDGRWSQEKFSNVITNIIKKSNDIAISTRRGAGNFAIVSTRLATALQAAGPTFSRNQANVNPTGTMTEIGTLNGNITVYHDTYHSAAAAGANDTALVGYKGPGISDAGLIYSPYIMGLMNRAIHPDDFSPRVGVMSRYAMTSNLLGAGRYYRVLQVQDLNTIIP